MFTNVQEDYYSKQAGCFDNVQGSGKHACPFPVADFWEGDHPATNITGWNTTYSLYIYTAQAIHLIEAQAAATKTVNTSRFFMYFASQNIHDPHQVRTFAAAALQGIYMAPSLVCHSALPFTVALGLKCTCPRHVLNIILYVAGVSGVLALPRQGSVRRACRHHSLPWSDPAAVCHHGILQVPQHYIDTYYPATPDCPASSAIHEEDSTSGCACCAHRTVMAMVTALDEASSCSKHARALLCAPPPPPFFWGGGARGGVVCT